MVSPADGEVPPTIEELHEVVAQMIEEGVLVAIPEVDPATDGRCIRYYHSEYAPKIN